ncbi:MAG: hypothetical protein RBS39_06110 [Phycisphaerales bacterium]|nr:hypothetical protein [Phycisphaerales bacterium]
MAHAPVLLADDSVTPHVRLRWQTASGWTELEADRVYSSPDEHKAMAENVSSFVALGGTRLDRGAGDPRGAIVRVGFYKVDAGAPFFAGMKNGGDLEIELSNVRFNQPVTPREESVLQHLKYTGAEAEACGLSSENVDFFNTSDPKDDLRGKIPHELARFGWIETDDAGPALASDAKAPRGHVSIATERDGTLTLRVRIPYALLRHARDPWKSTVPGTFFEPYHFHVEFEVLPEGAAPEADAGPRAGAGGSGAKDED